jgi:hypothetical protein
MNIEYIAGDSLTIQLFRIAIPNHRGGGGGGGGVKKKKKHWGIGLESYLQHLGMLFVQAMKRNRNLLHHLRNATHTCTIQARTLSEKE